MAKHLKVRACGKGNEVRLDVLHQSHLGGSFGGFGEALALGFMSYVFVHGRVRLRAVGVKPGFVVEKIRYGVQVTLGIDPYSAHIIIPKWIWPEVKAAIEEYNRRGAFE